MPQNSPNTCPGGSNVGESLLTEISTPAFIFDETQLLHAVATVKRIAADCRVLYSLKACSLMPVVEKVSSGVQGFSCSSLFEAMLAREFRSIDQCIHLTTPGISPSQIDALSSTCDYISFNSVGQLQRFSARMPSTVKRGLRINPLLSFVSDERYDPCRHKSKLGIPLPRLVEGYTAEGLRRLGVTGFHVHNNCDSADFSDLLATVRHIDKHLETLLRTVEWVNIGGGYLPSAAATIDPFHEAVGLLSDKYGVEVFFEPGAGIVKTAGVLVSSVVDLFESGDQTIAILDTTVNHWPEVFEYQFEPDVEGHVEDGRFTYLLAGCSCLAGDVFGIYSFNEPLEVGSRVMFCNAGAYSIVKANMFNGINLPNIYSLSKKGELVLVKRFTYEEFASHCGVDTRASVGT